jgi:hypothetical protein
MINLEPHSNASQYASINKIFVHSLKILPSKVFLRLFFLNGKHNILGVLFLYHRSLQNVVGLAPEFSNHWDWSQNRVLSKFNVGLGLKNDLQALFQSTQTK